jgi:hypothetical protein
MTEFGSLTLKLKEEIKEENEDEDENDLEVDEVDDKFKG